GEARTGPGMPGRRGIGGRWPGCGLATPTLWGPRRRMQRAAAAARAKSRSRDAGASRHRGKVAWRRLSYPDSRLSIRTRDSCSRTRLLPVALPRLAHDGHDGENEWRRQDAGATGGVHGVQSPDVVAPRRGGGIEMDGGYRAGCKRLDEGRRRDEW
ncbi:hypothetical protein FB451DRAFT_1212691, partial [Mycena latifolia]